VWAGGKNGSTDGWPPRPETRSNFIQSTRGGNLGGDEGEVEKRQRQRGGESRRKRTREKEWEKQGARVVARERTKAQKAACKVHTHKSARRSRSAVGSASPARSH